MAKSFLTVRVKLFNFDVTLFTYVNLMSKRYLSKLYDDVYRRLWPNILRFNEILVSNKFDLNREFWTSRVHMYSRSLNSIIELLPFFG